MSLLTSASRTRRASRYERLTACESPTGSFICITVSATLRFWRVSAIRPTSVFLRASAGWNTIESITSAVPTTTASSTSTRSLG
jgi:hypothetical protein